MSFEELVKSSVVRTKNYFTVEFGGKSYKFSASKITATAKANIAVAQANGRDWAALWVQLSIRDQDEKQMTTDQVERLPDEVLEKFLEEAIKANGEEQPAKKKSKSKR